MMAKPYQKIPIQDCGEPLVPIPLEQFAVVTPHPYQALGATYGVRSPYYLRQGVLAVLTQAQQALQKQYPGWKIQIFDAYRPVEVQQFMVDYTFAEALKASGEREETLLSEQRQTLWEQVYELWALPSANPATPPPHSTGAAIDVTLVDEKGQSLDMGSPIDELSMRSHPNYYADSADSEKQQYHYHRQILNEAMISAGFIRHPKEWWHFSYGDQMWVWQNQLNQNLPQSDQFARYGRS